MRKPEVLIVSPAQAHENNGNWQTAWRWKRLLAEHCTCQIVQQWSPGQGQPRAMLALHARRSAPSIEQWAQHQSNSSLALVLTGTDLYRDIASNAQAQRSLALAGHLVVLQELGVHALPDHYQHKTRVIFQSTSTRQTLAKSANRFKVVMVGHLREEKSPQTLMQAALLLGDQNKIQIDHLGAALDPVLGTLAQQTAKKMPAYRWLGAVNHEGTRRRIQRAHVLVHCSQMEGGAHVLMEAVCSGTPVLASRVDGNVGMLGQDYPGYFPWGDAQALATLLQRCQADAAFMATLFAHCQRRAPLFAPQREQAVLLSLVKDLTKA
jgi:putative glycosyltransferase (TIGR04348 family)